MPTPRRKLLAGLAVLAAVAGLAAAVVAVWFPDLIELLAKGETRKLRERSAPRTVSTERRPKLLVVGLDGIDRDLLYGMLREGRLPGFARLIGGQKDGRFEHAHFEEHVLATMPSSTLPGWATIYTAVPPSEHGVSGNELFIRERRQLAAPAPVSFKDPAPTLSVYTDDTADQILAVPTIFERMRDDDPGIEIWVSMGQFHRGADRLLMAKRTVLAAAFRDFLDAALSEEDDARDVYAELDTEALDTVMDELDELDGGPLPDVLTLYLAGVDLYAHHAHAGPHEARKKYLHEVLDDRIAVLAAVLEAEGALEDRYVVLVSEHGHTAIEADELHALGAEEDDELPAALRAAGFRLRPFEVEVPDDHDFQAVLAYGGATAYVYLADRSTCPSPGQRCDFTRPPRFEEDVLPVAEALLGSTLRGDPIAGLKGTLDLVLTRRARPYAEDDAPFEVYVGGGELRDVASRLATRDDDYVAAELRLRDLAAGPMGERAGDVMLITRNGSEPTTETRYYFSSTAYSWHGSPARKDSEVPLIVAHRKRRTPELAATVKRLLGPEPRLQAVGRLLLSLRRGEGE